MAKQVKKIIRLKSEYRNGRLYHHKKGGMNFAQLTQKQLEELYKEKIYRIFFE